MKKAKDFYALMQDVTDAARRLGTDFRAKAGTSMPSPEIEGLSAPKSRHELLAVTATLIALGTAISELPIVRENALEWKLNIAVDLKKRQPVTFWIWIAELEVTRPAAPRLPMVAEMLEALEDRLTLIARNCAAEAGDSRKYFVRADSRHDTYIQGRSPREAAWTYAALYLRSRREVREWRSAIKDITQVSRVHDLDDWIQLDPAQA